MILRQYTYMNIKNNIILFIIIILAIIVRFYKLEVIPPHLSWDEAANGYNAWTIANYGRDEYGKLSPLYFRSFGDDKHPVHIYLTAPFVKVFGLNEFATRFPSALFGVLNVLIIYFLAKIMFEKEFLAQISAFFLAISPVNIHFSRFNHEANFALFFFMLALFFFYHSIKKKKKLLFFSTLSFAVCFITYHPAKILVPVVLLILSILYWRKIFERKKETIFSFIIILLLGFVIIKNPQLLGIARIKQTALNQDQIKKTYLYSLTKNEFLGELNLVTQQYNLHLKSEFLFTLGDKNPKLSSHKGEFYKIEAILLFIGFIYLVSRKSKESIVLIIWALTAPIPSSLTSEVPHAARALFLMGSWNLISAIGFFRLITLLKKPALKLCLIIAIFVILIYSLINYLTYLGEYSQSYAIDWQYGYKQVVEYIKENGKYNQVFVTNVRSQPYIFFLYYLKVPLPDFRNTVLYNNSQTKSYNTVLSFDKYYFDGWDPVEIIPAEGVLYVLTPSQYDGLRHRSQFEVKKVVKFPNGTEAFYLVSK